MNGTTLRALRMALGYTQQEAALLIGDVQLRTWQYWEDGGRETPADVVETVRALCAWKAQTVQAAMQQIADMAVEHTPDSVNLTYYTNESDWLTQDGAESLLWRPHCMAMAEIAASSSAVGLIKFKPLGG